MAYELSVRAGDLSMISITSTEEEERMAAMRHGYEGRDGRLAGWKYEFSPYNSSDYDKNAFQSVHSFDLEATQFHNLFTRGTTGAGGAGSGRLGSGYSHRESSSVYNSDRPEPSARQGPHKHRSLFERVGKTDETTGKKELVGFRRKVRTLLSRRHASRHLNEERSYAHLDPRESY